MNTITVVMVRCRKEPQSALQFWVDHLSFIYSVCSACKARTDYGNTSPRDHYERFVNTGKRARGESIEACMDRLQFEIIATPENYRKEWE